LFLRLPAGVVLYPIISWPVDAAAQRVQEPPLLDRSIVNPLAAAAIIIAKVAATPARIPE
jgi:hypothetical protein